MFDNVLLYGVYMYMVTCLQAQKTNDGDLASSMFLPLAERLMEKYVNERKLDMEEGTVCKGKCEPVRCVRV